jgi:hypothetical protein
MIPNGPALLALLISGLWAAVALEMLTAGGLRRRAARWLRGGGPRLRPFSPRELRDLAKRAEPSERLRNAPKL